MSAGQLKRSGLAVPITRPTLICARGQRRLILRHCNRRGRKSGRHWVRDDLPVAVEFPGAGDDIERTVQVVVDGVAVAIIACEDLYLDRVRQATSGWPREDVSFDAALEIALTNYRDMDWDYVAKRILAAAGNERAVGETMRNVNRRVRARARRRAAEARGKDRP